MIVVEVELCVCVRVVERTARLRRAHVQALRGMQRVVELRTRAAEQTRRAGVCVVVEQERRETRRLAAGQAAEELEEEPADAEAARAREIDLPRALELSELIPVVLSGEQRAQLHAVLEHERRDGERQRLGLVVDAALALDASAHIGQ